jgi:hypothetical protein
MVHYGMLWCTMVHLCAIVHYVAVPWYTVTYTKHYIATSQIEQYSLDGNLSKSRETRKIFTGKYIKASVTYRGNNV